MQEKLENEFSKVWGLEKEAKLILIFLLNTIFDT